MNEFRDYYTILGIKDDASIADATSAFRRKVKEIRPDINLDEATRKEFQLLQEARDVLADPVERIIYHMKYTNHYFGSMFSTLAAEMNKAASDTESALRR